MNSLIVAHTEVNSVALPVVTYMGKPVVTTSTLAEMYATRDENIRVNFSRNKNKFEIERDYYWLTGSELKEFKELDRITDSNAVKVPPRTANLVLWTEEGAAMHAKMIETDEAWGVYRNLVNFYFRYREAAERGSSAPPPDSAQHDNAALKDTPEGAVAEFVANFYSECIDSGADLILANKYVAGFRYVFEKGVQTGKASAPRLAAPSDLDVDDRGYSHQTTLADAVDVPTKDFSGKRRSIPYLLRDAGLLDDGRRLTTLGEQYGEKRRVNGRPRLCWHIVRTSEYLTDWMAKNDW